MGPRNKNSIKGNDNNTTQIETQNNYYQTVIQQDNEYIPDEKASKLLKEAIEDDKTNCIMFIKSLGGSITIQCGLGRFSVNSEVVGEREMSYWQDALNNLQKYDYICDSSHKGEVFKISRKGYDYYDKYMNSDAPINQKVVLNLLHIKIFKMFRDNDYTLWDNQLNDFFKENIDYEIAFQELMDGGYIVPGLVYTMDNGCCYNIESSKKMEILKKLKELENNN